VIKLDSALPSDKQMRRVNKVMDFFGHKEVARYMRRFYPGFSYKSMTREQAQKIITGFDQQPDYSKFKDDRIPFQLRYGRLVK
jgi:hypothetical protein